MSDGGSNFIITIILIGMSLKFIWELGSWFYEKISKMLRKRGITIETKKEKEHREQIKRWKEFEDKLEDYQNSLDEHKRNIVDKQEEYQQQSIDIRNGLIENQKNLEENQANLKEDIKTLTDMFQEFVATDNERTVATLRTSLWRLHKEFVEQGYVTPDGLKTFTEMGSVYTRAGGDDIFHDKLEPEVLALDIHYPDGSIYKKTI